MKKVFAFPADAGGLGKLPSASALADVLVHRAGEKGKSSKATDGTLEALNRLNRSIEDEAEKAATAMVPAGTGLAALPKKLVDKMVAGEYVDFAELPPAKGKARAVPQALEGQVLVVQAADLMQSRKIIPDLATWVQCYALYVAAIAPHKPERVPELMAYQGAIAKASLKYKWPSWIVYDQNFRQEVANNPSQSWARVDPSMYAQCFTGQAISPDNWCARCQCLDHTSAQCPFKPQKRPWSTAFAASASPRAQNPGICTRYNKFGGDCRYGKDCKFDHNCSNCGEAGHWQGKCNGGKGGRRAKQE